MSSAAILNGVWAYLASDADLLSFKQIDLSVAQTQMMGFLKKGSQIAGIVSSDTVPIVLMYVRPGASDVRSTRVYNNKVVVDCYGKNASVAMDMAARVEELLEEWIPPSIAGSGFSKASETEIPTSEPGVVGHRLVFDCKTIKIPKRC